MKYLIQACTMLVFILLVNVVCLVKIGHATTAYDYAAEFFNDTGSRRAAIYSAYCRQACSEEFHNLYSEDDRNANCQPCYCDDSCKVHDDCCPDMFRGGQDGGEISELDESCESVAYPELPDPTDVACSDRVYCRGGESYYAHSSSFRLVSQCPKESDKNLKDACEESIKLPRSERLEPVTDSKTNISYFSAPCAQCNGVEQFKRWQAAFICRGQLPKSFGKTYRDIYDKLNNTESCFRIFWPPAEIPVRVCRTQQLISSCNVTGRWTDNSQSSLLADCTKGLELPVKQYKNIFCYLCNEDFNWPTFINDYKRHILYEESDSVLDIVLDIIVTLDDRFIEVEDKNYQVFDPYQLTCKDVECKDGMMLINGTCQSIGLHGNQYSYSICLDVNDVVSEDSISARDWCVFYRMFYNEHFFDDVSALGFKDLFFDCQFYYMNGCDKVKGVQVKVELQADVILEFPENLDGKAEKLFRFLETRNGKLPSNGRDVDVRTLRRCTKTDYQEQGSDETCNTMDIRNSRARLPPAKYTNIISNMHHWPPTKIRFCPFVTLEALEGELDSDSQSLTVLNTNRTLGPLEFNVVDGGRFEVCLEDYLDGVELPALCGEDTGELSPFSASSGCYLSFFSILFALFFCTVNL